MNEDRITDEQIEAAVSALREEAADLGDVLLLVRASLERKTTLVPQVVIDAAIIEWNAEAELANGGADQLVWNNGVAAARASAKTLREVGAIDNADLFDRLANELETYE